MGSYFVRNGRRFAGPFTLSELQQMAAIGRMNRSSLVSSDQQNWFPASELRDVFPDVVIVAPAQSSAELPPVAIVTPPKFRRYAVWKLLLFTVIVAPGLILVTDLATGGALGLTKMFALNASNYVQDANDDVRIRKAVGLVVCGLRLVDRKGDEKEYPLSTGSGFVITSDGFLITNKHVIEEIEPYLKNPSLIKSMTVKKPDGTDELLIPTELYGQLRMVDAILRVYLDGVAFPARIVFVSERFDLAVLRINTTNHPHFQLADSNEFRRNLAVFAAGFPSGATQELTDQGEAEAQVRQNLAKSIHQFFDESDFTYTQTVGAISRLENKTGAGVVIQHTANINKGNSGGPLFNEDGCVVGINTFGVIDQNTFYAVSIGQLKSEVMSVAPGAMWSEIRM